MFKEDHLSFRQRKYMKVKNIIGRALGGIGLVVLSPVYLAIIVAIKKEDGITAPVFFSQKRVGIHKEYFNLYKFRSMRTDTPHDKPTHLLENPDQYITKVGHFLRKSSLDELPQHAVVGTSSLRRQAQLLHYRPDLTVKSLRGNVQTRLRHLDEGEYDAVILAAAGLKRLGLDRRIKSYIDTNDSIPAAGQGVMAIEARTDDADTLEAVSFLHNANIAYCIRAERAFLAKVGGDCKVPAGIFVVPDGRKKIVAKAFIASPDGKELYRGEDGASDAEAEALGERLAEKLLNAGGREILKNLQKI